MSDIERVNEIERMIAEGRMSAAQVFTQMKQLLPSGKAPASGEVEPVVWIDPEDAKRAMIACPGERADVSPCREGRFSMPLYPHPPAKVPKKEALKAACTDFFYWWYNQPGSNTQQGFDEWFRDVGFSHFTTPTPATTPQTADRWIKCSERLPTEADEDCRGQVWSAYRDPVTKAKSGPHLQSVSMVLLCATDNPEALYWMPTGLKRPNPPAEGAE